MFFDSKSRKPPNPIYYFVSFISPYFLLYIKCPKTPLWQLARDQNEPRKIVDGTTERLVHPVLLFSSRTQADQYASEELGLRLKKVVFPGAGLSALWRNAEPFESVTLPEESVPVQKTLLVQPVVYVKAQASPLNAVHTLPVTERRRG